MKIAVCCASSNDIDTKYMESSKKLLEEIFQKDNDLVFGAFDSGIMGIAYRVAKNNNKKVIGAATEIYKEHVKELDCDTEILTPNVNKRTEAIINNSDVLLFLPGGIGTLYELITAIEMKRSKEFNKTIIVYNETGFFDEIIQALNKIYTENFTTSKVSYSYNIVNDNKEVMCLLEKIKNEIN